MKTSKTRLPDFLVIGAMKSATTSLFEYLSLHPQISVSKIKEPNFFNKKEFFEGTWEKGIEWYMSLFKNNLKIKGEASNAYTKYPADPDVAERIYSVLPKAKLIYVIRHPVARAVSHYLHALINGLERRTLKECLLKDINSNYINWGKYFLQLQQYLKYFDKKQIHVLTTEKLKTNRMETLKNIFVFLGVDSAFFTTKFTIEYNVTADKIWVLDCTNKMKLSEKPQQDAIAINPLQPDNNTEKRKTYVVGNRYYSQTVAQDVSSILNSKTNNIIAGLSEDEYMQLEHYFIDDIKQLSSFLNYNFLEWNLSSPLRSD